MSGLGRHEFLHPENRAYPVRTLLPETISVQTKVWPLEDRDFPLDQGQEGACVGFGWSAELSTLPIYHNTSNSYAQQYYYDARAVDRSMGNHWPEGASVLAGAKVALRRGLIKEYRWAFGLQDVRDTLITKGPVVIGVNWYESMYVTRFGGEVRISGDVVGGHCLLLLGYHKEHPNFGECYQWVNSWGRGYGVNGYGYIRAADLQRLLAENGEACIATDIPGRSPWWRRLFRL